MVLTEQYDFSWGQVPVSDPGIMRHNILQYCLKLLLSKDWKTSTKAVSDSPIFGPYKVQSGLQSKQKFMLDNSAIWLVNQNHKISKCIAEFHPEERANHVVIQ